MRHAGDSIFDGRHRLQYFLQLLVGARRQAPFKQPVAAYRASAAAGSCEEIAVNHRGDPVRTCL
ncbi:hypothetical protein GLA29479_2188 [Lysobacter antibioticus]|nr:hypothetical protein GLA29479_2188 [Lysobacter antibioticus]